MDGQGAQVNLSQTQIQDMAQSGGNLFTTAFKLAGPLLRPLAKPALKALGTAGLSFGAEKLLKKIFGSGYGPQEVQLYQLVSQMTPAHKKMLTDHLVPRGIIQGRGVQQYGGFLGMLAASLGVPLAIEAVKKLLGAGIQIGPPRYPPPPHKKG